MKQSTDYYTLDLLGNARGRPRKLNAKTGAKRQSEYRARQTKAKAISVTSDEKACCDLCVSHGKQCFDIGNVAHVFQEA